MNRCGSCKGFGVGLPLVGGLCDFCVRQGTVAAAGQKRSREESRAHDISGARALSAADIERILADGDEETVPTLDSTGVKRMLLALERALTKNITARAKYAGEPLKYLDSEVELDRTIKALHAIAAAPEEYAVLAESPVINSTLSALLAHENVDIAIDVIELLKELVDDDVVGVSDESRAAGAALIDAFVRANLFADVFENLDRLNAVFLSGTGDADAAADSNGVYAVFELVEAVLAVSPSLALSLCSPPQNAVGAPSPLISTIFSRLRAKPYDEVKGLASELLASLVVSDVDVVRYIGESAFPVRGRAPLNGIEHLLEALAVYKSKVPQGAEDEEAVGNLFDVLCTCLMLPENCLRFIAGEGFELMRRMVAEAGFSRFGALKTLSFACDSRTGAEALVASGCLKGVFPAFMGTGLVHTKKLHGAAAAKSEEEYACSIVSALFRHLSRATAGSPVIAGAGLEYVRLLAKFFENRGEKVDRLVELRVAYSQRPSEGAGDASDDDDDDDDEEAVRSNAYTLERVDIIIKTLLADTGDSGDEATDALVREVSGALRQRLTAQGIEM